MRKPLILLSLLVSATPALAQPPRLPPELTDPSVAQRLTKSMQVMSNALLDLRVGELKAASEGREPSAAERKLTVRDLGRREDRNFDRNFQQKIANAGPVIDRSVKALNQALPSLLQSLEETREALERAAANMPDPSYPKR